jgi:hypothetical protein
LDSFGVSPDQIGCFLMGGVSGYNLLISQSLISGLAFGENFPILSEFFQEGDLNGSSDGRREEAGRANFSQDGDTADGHGRHLGRFDGFLEKKTQFFYPFIEKKNFMTAPSS